MSSERHKNLVLRFHEEMWNRGEPAIGDELFAPNYVRHDLRPGTPPPGPEGQKEIARLFRAAFPDLHITVGLIVADDTYVVVRWTMRGTHVGEWAGIKPTGRKIEFSGVNIFRFEHGKVVELWNHRDDLGLQLQLGVPIHAGYPG